MKKNTIPAIYIGQVLHLEESDSTYEYNLVARRFHPVADTFSAVYEKVMGYPLTQEKWENILVYRLRDENKTYMERETESLKGLPDVLRAIALGPIEQKFNELVTVFDRMHNTFFEVSQDVSRSCYRASSILDLSLFHVVNGKVQYNKEKAIKRYQTIIESKAQAEAYRLALPLQETYSQLINHMAAHGLHPECRILGSQAYIWENKHQLHVSPNIITLVKG